MLIYEPNKKISKYFEMYEIAKSTSGERWGIDNTPSSEVIINAERLAKNILDLIREHFNKSFSPNSWYRGEELERKINDTHFANWCIKKGKKNNDISWKEYFSLKSHPKGEAADIEIPGVSNDDLFNWIKNNIPVYDQLIREFPKKNIPSSGWVHISLKESGNRKESFIIN